MRAGVITARGRMRITRTHSIMPNLYRVILWMSEIYRYRHPPAYKVEIWRGIKCVLGDGGGGGGVWGDGVVVVVGLWLWW
jgi:hypothetical protein